MRPYDDEYDYNESNNITSKGKFEGCPAWVPMLWDRALSGFSDVSVHDGTMAIDAFKLDENIASLTGLEPDPNRYVALWESDDGFVTHMVMTEAELHNVECALDDDDFGFLDFGGEGG